MSSSKGKDDGGGWDGFKSFYLRQFISLFWMLGAVGIGLILREWIPWLNENVDYPLMALISGIIGIAVPNLAQFRNAGKVLTRGDNRKLNLLVGVGVILLVLILFNALFRGLL